MSLENETNFANTSLKQKFSGSNDYTGTVLQDCSPGDKSLEHKLQCSTPVIDNKCLRDSSLRNKLLSTASLMYHSHLENQNSWNVLFSAASSLQHSPRDPSLDSGTKIRHNAIGASFSENSYIISHSQTSLSKKKCTFSIYPRFLHHCFTSFHSKTIYSPFLFIHLSDNAFLSHHFLNKCYKNGLSVPQIIGYHFLYYLKAIP